MKKHTVSLLFTHTIEIFNARSFSRANARAHKSERTEHDATARPRRWERMSLFTHTCIVPARTRNPIRATSPRGRVWMTLRRSFFSLAIYVCAMIHIQHIDICIMYPYDGINVSMFCSLCKVVVDSYDVVGATDTPRNPPLIETLLFRVGRRVCTYASTPRAKKHRVD